MSFTKALPAHVQRIAVIGSPGSGKSTLSRVLGDKLSLPVVHMDRLYWQAGWLHLDEEAMKARVMEEVARPAWIIDGNYNRTLDLRLHACEAVVYLDLPRTVCLWNVLRRFFSYRHKTRPDMPPGCPEGLDWEFIVYIWRFNGKYRQAYLKKLEEIQPVAIALHSHREVKAFLDGLAS